MKNPTTLVPMQVICSWCKKFIKEELISRPKGFRDKVVVSHGICKECVKEMEEKYKL
jgi:hypothetical protein